MAKVSVVTIGSYGSKLAVPATELGALMTLLAKCTMVSREWMENREDVLVIAKHNVEVVQVDGSDILTLEEFKSIKEAMAAEKAAAAAEVPAES